MHRVILPSKQIVYVLAVEVSWWTNKKNTKHSGQMLLLHTELFIILSPVSFVLSKSKWVLYMIRFIL